MSFDTRSRLLHVFEHIYNLLRILYLVDNLKSVFLFKYTFLNETKTIQLKNFQLST